MRLNGILATKLDLPLDVFNLMSGLILVEDSMNMMWSSYLSLLGYWSSESYLCWHEAIAFRVDGTVGNLSVLLKFSGYFRIG